MKQPGATVCVPIEKSFRAPRPWRLKMLRTKPFAGTGCQKLSPSSGPMIFTVPAWLSCTFMARPRLLGLALSGTVGDKLARRQPD